METKFINRLDEFKKIKEIINSKKHTSCGGLLLLYSKSGIGKARLVEEYVEKYYPVSFHLNVKIPNSPQRIVEPYHYFNILYQELFQNNNWKFKPFFSGMSLSVFFTQLHLGLELSTDYPKEVNRKLKSIQRIFKNYTQPIIIVIENAQSIDEESLHIIKSFLQDFPNLLFFLLYNIDNHYTKGIMNSFFEDIQKFSIVPYPISISKLKFTHVLEVLELSEETCLGNQMLKEAYQTYEGNMDELIVCSLENNCSKKEGYDAIIMKVSPHAKFIMYILLYYMGEIQEKALIELLKDAPCSEKNLHQNFLAELEQNHIIERKNGRVTMNNSMINYLENLPFSEEGYTALRIVIENSWCKLEQNNEEFSALYRLVYLYSLLNDKEIFNLFPYIKKYGAVNGNIKEILNRIEQICSLKCKDSSLREEVILESVDILYTIGDMKTAREKLDTIFCQDNFRHEMYNLALKAVLNEDDFIFYVKNLIMKYEESPRIELFCKYMYLYHMMRQSPSAVAEHYAKSILNDERYRLYSEYYFVLKNYSVYLNNNEAIKILQKCIDYFRLNERNDLAIRTTITLAMRYANIGELGRARKILKEAESENKYACKECYFLNNFSVIDILEKQFTENVEINLKNALLFSPNTYEKGIILSNLLIYYCETNSMEDAKYIVDCLEAPRYSAYKFEQYRHILHYNLYYYYSLIGDSTSQLRHYSALKDLYKSSPLELKEYMNATVFHESELPVNHRRYFYSKYPYRPDYIGYWQLEVPSFKKDSPNYF